MSLCQSIDWPKVSTVRTKTLEAGDRFFWVVNQLGIILINMGRVHLPRFSFLSLPFSAKDTFPRFSVLNWIWILIFLLGSWEHFSGKCCRFKILPIIFRRKKIMGEMNSLKYLLNKYMFYNLMYKNIPQFTNREIWTNLYYYWILCLTLT